MNIHKSAKESATQFLARLRTLFMCYIETREVEHSYEAITEMVISDRFRDSLSREERLFIADKEVGKYLTGSEIAVLMDIYNAERTDYEDDVTEKHRTKHKSEIYGSYYYNRSKLKYSNSRFSYDKPHFKNYHSGAQSDVGNSGKVRSSNGIIEVEKDKKASDKVFVKKDLHNKPTKNFTVKTRLVEVENSSDDSEHSNTSEDSSAFEEEDEELKVSRI